MANREKNCFFYFASECWKGIDSFVFCSFSLQESQLSNRRRMKQKAITKKHNISLFIHPTIFSPRLPLHWVTRVFPSCLWTGCQLVNGLRQTTILTPRPVWSSQFTCTPFAPCWLWNPESPERTCKRRLGLGQNWHSIINKQNTKIRYVHFTYEELHVFIVVFFFIYQNNLYFQAS